MIAVALCVVSAGAYAVGALLLTGTQGGATVLAAAASAG